MKIVIPLIELYSYKRDKHRCIYEIKASAICSWTELECFISKSSVLVLALGSLTFIRRRKMGLSLISMVVCCTYRSMLDFNSTKRRLYVGISTTHFQQTSKMSISLIHFSPTYIWRSSCTNALCLLCHEDCVNGIAYH